MPYQSAKNFTADPATSPELLAKIYGHFAVYEAFGDSCPFADPKDHRYDKSRVRENEALCTAERQARIEFLKFPTNSETDLQAKIGYIRFHSQDAFEDFYSEELEALLLSVSDILVVECTKHGE